MTEAATLASAAAAGLVPTPNHDAHPRRFSDFATFGDAIDYAAQGVRGMNFHDPRGTLIRVYPFSELRQDALDMAYRLIAHGIGKGDRVALIAETGPEFAALFCGTVYAGAWPVPLPLPTSFGGKDGYIDQLAVQLQSSDPKVLFYPAEIAEMAGAAAKRQEALSGQCDGIAWEDFAQSPAVPCDLPPRRHLLSAVLQRLYPFPAWCRGNPRSPAQ
jgi:fatty-acyl-CoA synthase